MVSRRVLRGDQFVGVSVAAINAGFFERIFKAASLGTTATATLPGASGEVLGGYSRAVATDSPPFVPTGPSDTDAYGTELKREVAPDGTARLVPPVRMASRRSWSPIRDPE